MLPLRAYISYYSGLKTTLPTRTVQEIDHIEAGRRIRALRESTGMSLRWLATQMGFSAPFISDLELGRRNWTEYNFNKAVRLLTLSGQQTTRNKNRK